MNVALNNIHSLTTDCFEQIRSIVRHDVSNTHAQSVYSADTHI